MSARQLHQLEQQYLMALCCLDLYRLQGGGESLSAGQFAATQGLDWNEREELREHLEGKDITV